eukprot:CAMPEP_0172487844 /NCGR_PEP_ID=MMETSP1066-20121228/17084_1 /TAXON_ID=671091 /ORGANISM="Coscinodiscus wailesii, Strain CCMP2513" /LENGTH=521 /DNA_ID=CAMNT_0013254699 /DNA_START=46 /DNA_END=1611 /DNA_ORIENTATION=+
MTEHCVTKTAPPLRHRLSKESKRLSNNHGPIIISGPALISSNAASATNSDGDSDDPTYFDRFVSTSFRNNGTIRLSFDANGTGTESKEKVLKSTSTNVSVRGSKRSGKTVSHDRKPFKNQVQVLSERSTINGNDKMPPRTVTTDKMTSPKDIQSRENIELVHVTRRTRPSTNNPLEKRLSRKKCELSKIKKANLILQKELKVSQNEIICLQKEFTHAMDEMQTLEEENDSQATTIDGLTRKVRSLEADIKRMKRDATKRTEQLLEIATVSETMRLSALTKEHELELEHVRREMEAKHHREMDEIIREYEKKTKVRGEDKEWQRMNGERDIDTRDGIENASTGLEDELTISESTPVHEFHSLPHQDGVTMQPESVPYTKKLAHMTPKPDWNTPEHVKLENETIQSPKINSLSLRIDDTAASNLIEELINDDNESSSTIKDDWNQSNEARIPTKTMTALKKECKKLMLEKEKRIETLEKELKEMALNESNVKQLSSKLRSRDETIVALQEKLDLYQVNSRLLA